MGDFRIEKAIGDNRYFVVEVSYSKGGLNFFTYKEEKRGIYIHFREEEIEDNGEYKTIKFDVGSGYKILFKELKRKSQKELQKAYDSISQIANELYKEYRAGNHNGVYDAVKRIAS